MKAHHSNQTRDRLIEVTKKLIDQIGITSVTSSLVLSTSGVSKSSLYHFFEDFEDLISQSLISQYEDFDETWCREFWEIASDSANSSEFKSALTSILNESQRLLNRELRFQKILILSTTKNSILMRERIGSIQEKSTLRLTQAVELAQAKGFIISKFEPRTIGIAIQAIMIGKIFDDILIKPMKEEDWQSLSLAIIEAAFLSHEN